MIPRILFFDVILDVFTHNLALGVVENIGGPDPARYHAVEVGR